MPTEIVGSAGPAAASKGMGFPNSVDLTPHTYDSTLPSQRTITSLTKPKKHSQLTSNTTLSRRKNLPLLPKAPATHQTTNVRSSGILHHLPSPLSVSFDVISASHAASTVAKKKRKRSRSPYLVINNIPEGFCNEFQVTGAVEKERQQLPARKRAKSAKTCLRCQSQQIKASHRCVLRVLS